MNGQYSGDCYALTSDLSQPMPSPLPVVKNVFDAKNPARGWQMTYLGGPAEPGCPSGRTFTYTFMCDRTTPAPPMSTTNYTFVMELSGCSYTAYMYSQLGCPERELEARVARGKIDEE